VDLASKFYFKRWYTALANSTADLHAWTFMNYGYAGDKDIELGELDEWNRYPVQLYHHLFRDLEVEGSDVLDIGSGRGGGSAYIASALAPASMTGVDLCNEAVELSRRLHGENEVLRYVRGDAEALPFEDEEFDIVISVEASHCFSSMTRFFENACRVLRPGGHFVFTDFRSEEDFEKLNQELDDSPLKLIEVNDITKNVIQALKLDDVRKTAFRDEYLEGEIKERFTFFAALQGSQSYEAFISGHYLYRTFRCQRADEPDA
jgi:ubiquinone/menaquinone biosynthesis C-methylase UbiE